MMKRFLLLAAVVACGKPNEVKTLHREAVVVAQSYQSQLDELDRRLQTIYKRGTTVPGNLPGIDVVTTRLREAQTGIAQLRLIVGAPGQANKSEVEKTADEAAKARNVGNLQKLIADTEKTLDEGTTIIRGDLTTVENWIAQYDQGTNRVGGPQPGAPTGPEGGQPEGGQPPAPAPAPAPGGAPPGGAGNQPTAPSTAQPTPAPAHP